MPPKGSKASKNATKSESTLISEASETWRKTSGFFMPYIDGVTNLKEWLQDEGLVKRYWRIFYQHTDSLMDVRKAESGPTLKAVMDQIKKFEGNDSFLYTTAGVEDSDKAREWLLLDWYSYFVCNVEKVNKTYRTGIYYRSEGKDYEERLVKILVALRRLINDHTKSKYPLISKEDLSIAPRDKEFAADDVEGGVADTLEGVTIMWRNRNSELNGSPRDYSGEPEELEEWRANIPGGYEFGTLASLRNFARTQFGITQANCRIAELYTLMTDPNDEQPWADALTQTKWSQMRHRTQGKRGRVYLIINTIKRENILFDALPDQEDPDSTEDYCAVFNSLVLTDFVPKIDQNLKYRIYNLDMQGKQCTEYKVMEDSKPADAPTNMEIYPIDRYKALFRAATRTDGKNPEADVVKKDVSGGLDLGELQSIDDLWSLDVENAIQGESRGGTSSGAAEIAAVKGNMQFADPGAKAKRVFEENQAIMDNTLLQRENIKEANEMLRFVDSVHPVVPGMITKLYPHQIVAVAFIKGEQKGPVGGGILADATGLGKTLTFIATIQSNLNDRRAEVALRERKRRFGPPKPVLLIVPNNIVLQWCEEINHHAQHLKVVVYYSGYTNKANNPKLLMVLPQKGADALLTRSHTIFKRAEENAGIVVITTPRYISGKHGPNAQRKWLISQKIPVKMRENDQNAPANAHYYHDLHPDWPGNLHGCFGDIYVDEMQMMRGGLQRQLVRTVCNLGARSVTGATATPIINDGPKDLKGILEAIQQRGKDPWSTPNLRQMGVDSDCNPFDLEDGHPASYLRSTPQAIQEFMMKPKMPVELIGSRIQKLYRKSLIRRTFAAKIPFADGKAIGAEMPFIENKRYEVDFTAEEYETHSRYHNASMIALFKRIDGKMGKKMIIFDSYELRTLCHLSLWTKLVHLSEDTLANLHKYRSKPDFTIRDLCDLIVKDSKEDLELPGPSDEDLIDWVVDGAPKMRLLAWITAELVVKKEEKLVTWSTTPWQQFYICLFLKFFAVDAASYHSGLTATERSELAWRFHTTNDTPMVLCCSYFVNNAGMNLHGKCRNTLQIEPPPTIPIGEQGDGRVYRLGQLLDVRNMKIRNLSTWNAWQESNALVKSLPGLMADISSKNFKDDEAPEDGESDSIHDSEESSDEESDSEERARRPQLSNPSLNAKMSGGEKNDEFRRYVQVDGELLLASEYPDRQSLSAFDLLVQIQRKLRGGFQALMSNEDAMQFLPSKKPISRDISTSEDYSPIASEAQPRVENTIKKVRFDNDPMEIDGNQNTSVSQARGDTDTMEIDGNHLEHPDSHMADHDNI